MRLAAYDQSTSPLIDFYEKLGLLMRVEAKGTPDEICARTLAALDRRLAEQLS